MAMTTTTNDAGWDLAVIGAGPAGLALALQAARSLPDVRVTLFDARPLERDVSTDPRTLAVSLGSIHLLERLGGWDASAAQPIHEVHVSEQQATPGRWSVEPAVCIRALDEGVPLLGAVLSYGALVAPLQRAWLERAATSSGRLVTRFGTPVAGLKPVPGGVEVDAGIAERYDLAVVAEGGVFADQARKAIVRDYHQVAWVGTVTLEGGRPGVAYERFTPEGPVALLPLKDGRAALVWCVPSEADPVLACNDDERVAALNRIFDHHVGRITSVSPLKRFPLGLNAERHLTEGRILRIGNAAQTLHPVAGQGLNLGLRDAHALVSGLARPAPAGTRPDLDGVLRQLERGRTLDRWTTIATTDFLARSFTWRLPGLGAARGLGMAALQRLGPLRSRFARQMMFGLR